MIRQELIDLMFRVSGDRDAFDTLETTLSTLSKEEVEQSLVECGVLPEVFGHDSSEEKLWAKYSDILFARALSSLNIDAAVIRTRGDSADVLGKTSEYSIVGDAKTFRLSRTAKNQKDFKIKALSDWRRNDTYAVLVGPLSQFPTDGSQIYRQAVERNVTLLSYVHLRFLMESLNEGVDLSPLWKTGMRLAKTIPIADQKKAVPYWREIDNAVCEIARKSESDLGVAKLIEHETTKRLGMEGIVYWEAKIAEIRALPKEEAIRRLIRAEKIEQKILQIKKAIERECAL